MGAWTKRLVLAATAVILIAGGLAWTCGAELSAAAPRNIGAPPRALFAAAREPKLFWPVDGAAHVNLHLYAKAEYERRVTAFLDTYLVSGPTSATGEAVGQ